jgi:hypothetical protein
VDSGCSSDCIFFGLVHGSLLELIREGISFFDIIRDYYSYLKHEDIQVCVQYAIDVFLIEDLRRAIPAAGLPTSIAIF